MRVSGSRQQTLGDLRESTSLGGFTDFGRGNPPWLPRLWVTKRVTKRVAKRVGTGARILPEVD